MVDAVSTYKADNSGAAPADIGDLTANDEYLIAPTNPFGNAWSLSIDGATGKIYAETTGVPLEVCTMAAKAQGVDVASYVVPAAQSNAIAATGTYSCYGDGTGGVYTFLKK